MRKHHFQAKMKEGKAPPNSIKEVGGHDESHFSLPHVRKSVLETTFIFHDHLFTYQQQLSSSSSNSTDIDNNNAQPNPQSAMNASKEIRLRELVDKFRGQFITLTLTSTPTQGVLRTLRQGGCIRYPGQSVRVRGAQIGAQGASFSKNVSYAT